MSYHHHCGHFSFETNSWCFPSCSPSGASRKCAWLHQDCTKELSSAERSWSCRSCQSCWFCLSPTKKHISLSDLDVSFVWSTRAAKIQSLYDRCFNKSWFFRFGVLKFNLPGAKFVGQVSSFTSLDTLLCPPPPSNERPWLLWGYGDHGGENSAVCLLLDCPQSDSTWNHSKSKKPTRSTFLWMFCKQNPFGGVGHCEKNYLKVEYTKTSRRRVSQVCPKNTVFNKV